MVPMEAIIGIMIFFALAGFTFCAGLLDTLRSPVAPSSDWFCGLPGDIPKDVWGVYVLVFKKAGQIDAVYVGSGTATYRGVRARLGEYLAGKKFSHEKVIAHLVREYDQPDVDYDDQSENDLHPGTYGLYDAYVDDSSDDL